MADLRTDLVNELRNQKYYLEQDFVRLVNAPVTNYKGRLEEIKDCLVEIGKLNTAIAMIDVYLPQQEQPVSAPAPAPEGDVSAPSDIVSAEPVPQPVPQPVAGQTHAE